MGEKLENEVKSVSRNPYNIKERKIKNAAYRSLIRPELADELYEKILNIVVFQKKYRDPDYSAKKLAEELDTNTRYLSVMMFKLRKPKKFCLFCTTTLFHDPLLFEVDGTLLAVRRRDACHIEVKRR